MILINVRIIDFQRPFSAIEYQKIILIFLFLKSNFSIKKRMIINFIINFKDGKKKWRKNKKNPFQSLDLLVIGHVGLNEIGKHLRKSLSSDHCSMLMWNINCSNNNYSNNNNKRTKLSNFKYFMHNICNIEEIKNVFLGFLVMVLCCGLIAHEPKIHL